MTAKLKKLTLNFDVVRDLSRTEPERIVVGRQDTDNTVCPDPCGSITGNDCCGTWTSCDTTCCETPDC